MDIFNFIYVEALHIDSFQFFSALTFIAENVDNYNLWRLCSFFF